MMWDAVNLFIVNKIPLFENDLKNLSEEMKLQFEFKFRIRPSKLQKYSTEMQTNLRNSRKI